MEDGNAFIAFISPHLVNIAIAIAIFIVGKWLASRIAGLIKTMLDRKVDSTVSSFAGNMAHVVLVAFVIIAALDQLGVQTTSLVAIFGAVTLAIGFAMKDSLGNFASGVMLIILKPFKVGDFIEAGGTMGVVKEISIVATILKSGDNKIITVPNGRIMGGNIVNYSEMPTRRVDMVFGVSYDSDLSKVKEILTDILENDERVLKEPKPVIVVGELGDSSVDFLCRPWVNSADFWAVKWAVTEEVKRRFDAAGISIPFPQMDVHLDKVEH